MQSIPQPQYDVYSQLARADFIRRMKLHLRYAFPDECSQLEDAKLSELIESGISKAAVHAIDIEAGVAKYISLMVAFGPDFDKDAKHDWAHAVLEDEELDDPAHKANLLFDAALEHARIEEGISQGEDE